MLQLYRSKLRAERKVCGRGVRGIDEERKTEGRERKMNDGKNIFSKKIKKMSK